jgi:hypothetical protein
MCYLNLLQGILTGKSYNTTLSIKAMFSHKFVNKYLYNKTAFLTKNFNQKMFNKIKFNGYLYTKTFNKEKMT